MASFLSWPQCVKHQELFTHHHSAVACWAHLGDTSPPPPPAPSVVQTVCRLERAFLSRSPTRTPLPTLATSGWWRSERRQPANREKNRVYNLMYFTQHPHVLHYRVLLVALRTTCIRRWSEKKSLAPRVILYSIDFHMQLTVNNSMGPMAPYGDADLRTLAEVLAWCNGRTKLKLVLTYHQMCSLALTKHNFTENDQGINPQN